ncbi:MAG: NAD-dependent epimerase/dehydratase family protein [Alphaproteobacteria bacterium]|nr:NAD-dependent epimerase/dehydratase family protein [Alphaproteobacteria bacterium]MCB9699461.1 NAD-dependent epimerase/dehydratase family protein [Alphaproteobacteria bacterium]
MRPEQRAPVLVTGAAGFIGSHLVAALLADGRRVVGLDDLSTGRRENLPDHEHFRFVEGSIGDEDAVRDTLAGVRIVLHQAALGSVPRSVAHPEATFAANVTGFGVLAIAAARAEVDAFVYASSSSVYGDSPVLPRREAELGRALSPYAASKRMGELWAQALAASHGLPAVGLRYFNVVGPRQRPDGPYATVLPRWIRELRQGVQPVIYGGGHRTRDYTPVANVVHANLLAAARARTLAGEVFNVGLGRGTSLGELFALVRDGLAARGVPCAHVVPDDGPERAGDLVHGVADLTLARDRLGYAPVRDLEPALDELLGSPQGL